jgi:hypothetical protein
MEFVNYSSNYACQNGLRQLSTLATFGEVCRIPSPLSKGFHVITLFPKVTRKPVATET